MGKMKVKINDPRSLTYFDLEVGELFYCASKPGPLVPTDVYMKIEELGNAVWICSGVTRSIDDETQVVRLDGTITVGRAP